MMALMRCPRFTAQWISSLPWDSIRNPVNGTQGGPRLTEDENLVKGWKWGGFVPPPRTISRTIDAVAHNERKVMVVPRGREARTRLAIAIPHKPARKICIRTESLA